MQFTEKFEVICRMIDDRVVSLGLFNSYEEANDCAIMQASVALPDECVKAYQIQKVYINIPVFTSDTPSKASHSKRGD